LPVIEWGLRWGCANFQGCTTIQKIRADSCEFVAALFLVLIRVHSRLNWFPLGTAGRFNHAE
jgi:hypothetical protein